MVLAQFVEKKKNKINDFIRWKQMNKCDKCSLLEKDFIGYKVGYGSKYSPNVIAELNMFR